MIGESIQNYVITAKIGEGGMGTVYLADDNLLDRQVAIKVLHPRLVQDEMLMERFKNEAKTLARLNHPNITTLYSLIQHGASFCMVLEYVDGITLEDFLGKYGALPPAFVANLAYQVLDGLNYAHEKGIVHRDIKPANLMVTRDGKIKIMDFGIARVMGSSRSTRVGTAIGTLEYMSPEQIRSEEVTPRSDIYSMGIVLYEMLLGKVPFKGDSEYNLMQSQINQKPLPLRASLPHISDALNNAVLKALEKDPAKRFPNATAFWQALAAAVPGGLMSLAAFEASRQVQIKETQVLTNLSAPKAGTAKPYAASGPSWWQKIIEDGNTARKIFFGVVGLVVLFFILNLVCSRKKDQPEIVSTETPTTIAPPQDQPVTGIQSPSNSNTNLEVNEQPASDMPDEPASTKENAGTQGSKPAGGQTGKPGPTSGKQPPTKNPSDKNQAPQPAPSPKPEPPKPEPPKPETPKQEPVPAEPAKVVRTREIDIDNNKFLKVAPRKTIDPASLKVGDKLYFKTLSSYVQGDLTVIERGATVEAIVKEANPKNIVYEYTYVQTVNEKVTLGIYDPIRKIKFTDWQRGEFGNIELKKTKRVVITY